MQQPSALIDARARLLAHPLYAAVDSMPRLRRFMETHVFAVWDFMSLAKRLQRDLTCTTLPWLPPANARLARFINEVIVAEESDVALDGGAMSHVELYVAAMREVGADTTALMRFMDTMRAGTSPETALRAEGVPAAARPFVERTLHCALHAGTAEVAATFLYGREAIIPDMFRALLRQWDRGRRRAPCFSYYLERHIQVDGETHGPLAEAMLEELIAGDPARRATADAAALEAVTARIALWDGVLRSLAPA